MKKKVSTSVPIVVDTDDAQTLFVDGINGIEIRGGVAVFNLMQHILPASGSHVMPYDKTVLRLAMPQETFANVGKWFGDVLSAVKDGPAGGGQ